MKYYLKHSLLYHSCNSYDFFNSVNRAPHISTDSPVYINSTLNPSQQITSIISSVNPNLPKQVPFTSTRVLVPKQTFTCLPSVG